MKKRKISILIIFVVAIILFMVGKMIEGSKSNKERISIEDYYDLKNEEAKLFIDLKETEAKGLVKEGQGYLPFSLATEFIPRLFLEADAGKIYFTTATEIHAYTIDSKEYLVNKKKKSHDYPLFIREGDEVYVALDFINKMFVLRFDVIRKPNRILIFKENGTYRYRTVKKETEIREKADKKTRIVDVLSEGAKVWILEKEEDGFTEVVSDQGVKGFVLSSKLSKEQEESFSFAREKDETLYKSLSLGKPVVMAWHQVFNNTANGTLGQLLKDTKGVNVISPTWFGIIKNNGKLSSLASKEYVARAHAMGLQVWPIINDFNTKVNYDELFMKEENRYQLIKNIIYFINEYDLDGINIDFETVKGSYAEGYVQFLRELSVYMRLKKKFLSIDNYVPASHTEHYNRKEQGVLADYVCVMAYDEHYFGSPEPGSVSSLQWVRRGIDMTSEEVDPKKLIVGLPFYTRIWKVKSDGGIETKALSMDGGFGRVKKGKAKPQWDESTGQYYAEWQEKEDIFKIWLEDARSIETKLNEVDRSRLAGVAFWKLGLEREAVWNKVEAWLEK